MVTVTKRWHFRKALKASLGLVNDENRNHIASHLGGVIALLVAILLITRPDSRTGYWSLSAESCTNPRNDPFKRRSNYVLRSTRVVLPNGLVTAADIGVAQTGKIMFVDQVHHSLSPSLGSWNFPTRNDFRVIDVSPLVVMPGLIDPHVHVNSPGKTHWEGYGTASRAAAVGGTTTILDMPLNNVPSTINMPALAAKAAAVADAGPLVDVGFIGGVVPTNLPQLRDLLHAGVVAFKSFMIDSQSKDFSHVSASNLSDAMHALANLKEEYQSHVKGQAGFSNLASRSFPPYILHAELPPASYLPQVPYPGEPQSYASYLQSRPDSWEIDAVSEALRLSDATKCRIHIAHISSSAAADLVAEHRLSKKDSRDLVSSETCPQYLVWAAEDIPDGRTEFKCAPPIRSRANRRQLWSHVRESRGVDMIASDHSPAPPSLKRFLDGDFKKAWGGIAGLQYRLQGAWTAMQELDSRPSLALLSHLLSAAPARAFGLDQRKGAISPGLDADFVIWNPETSTVAREGDCEHRFPFSPFVGMNMSGQVYWTLLRGKALYSRIVSFNEGEDGFSRERFGRVLGRNSATGAISAMSPSKFSGNLAQYLL